MVRGNFCPDVFQEKSSESGDIGYPFPTKNKKMCTMMLLLNLAEPDWISIFCNRSILPIVICVKDELMEKPKADIHLMDLSACSVLSIVVHKECFVFEWKPRNETKFKGFSRSNQKIEYKKVILNFQHIFDVIITPTSSLSVLVMKNLTSLNVLKFQKYLDITTSEHFIMPFTEAEGFHLFKLNKYRLNLGSLLFSCSSGGYIMNDFICDHFIDCPNDNSDEEQCTCTMENKTGYCRYTKTGGDNIFCGLLYYKKLSGACQKYSNVTLIKTDFKTYKSDPELIKGMHKRLLFVTTNQTKFKFDEVTFSQMNDKISNFIRCHNNQKVKKIFIDDLVPDCVTNAEDEPKLKSILELEKFYSCQMPYEIPCKEGHDKCYNITEVCIYTLNMYNHMTPCRNGAHVQNCVKFECNMMYKCLNSYCIPWSYVCNGVWDCPSGNEEANICQKTSKCIQMYKCRKTHHICIHLGNVCDNTYDCPHGDDELLCIFRGINCPEDCECLLYAISCRGDMKMKMYLKYPEIYLFVFFSDLDISLHNMINKFINVLVIKLPRNNFTTFCPNLKCHKCVFLHLGYNLINRLEVKCFTQLHPLVALILNNNYITKIQEHSFDKFVELKLLNISQNPLTSLSELFLINTQNLKILDIMNMSFRFNF